MRLGPRLRCPVPRGGAGRCLCPGGLCMVAAGARGLGAAGRT